MDITSAKYIVNIEGSNDSIEATIDGVTMSVPLNVDNRDYRAKQEWVSDGNAIEEAS